jgi:peptidoglycan/LPS O-acetylase OafA/YrhL
MFKGKSNLISIDIVRAIAALGVYFYHSAIGSMLYKYLKIPLIKNIDAFGATYAVPLFFLISGYCIHLSNLKYIKSEQPLPLIQYYKRRLLRIFPPYLVALLLSILINFYTKVHSQPTTNDLIIHLFCLQGFSVPYFNTINLVLWTITVEIAFYLIYPLFYYLRYKYSLNTAIISVFLISAINIIYLSLEKAPTLPQFFWVGNLWFAWCVGAFIADKIYFDANSIKKNNFKIAYLIIFTFFAFSFFNNYSFLSIPFYQFKILIWTGPLVFIISKEGWLQKHNNFFIKTLGFIGLSSYSLYLLHEPLISLKNYIIHAYLPKSLQLPVLVLGILIIPFITWLNYCIVEKPFIGSKKPAKE